MSNPDSKLKLLEEMALLAKSSPANSKERQKWLTKLTNEIQNSNRIYEQSLDVPLQSEQSSWNHAPDTSLLDIIEQTESLSPQKDWERLWDFIQKDPRDCFRQTHIEKHPEANFQAICIRRFNGQSWKEMSTEWGISLATLSSFYQRSVDKLQPIFQEYL